MASWVPRRDPMRAARRRASAWPRLLSRSRLGRNRGPCMPDHGRAGNDRTLNQCNHPLLDGHILFDVEMPDIGTAFEVHVLNAAAELATPGNLFSHLGVEIDISLDVAVHG